MSGKEQLAAFICPVRPVNALNSHWMQDTITGSGKNQQQKQMTLISNISRNTTIRPNEVTFTPKLYKLLSVLKNDNNL